MDVRIFKVNSGEQFIAEVVDESSNSDVIELKNHCAIFPNPDGSNGVQVMQSHTMFGSTVNLNKNAIVFSGIPQEEILEQFIEAFKENKILVPQQKIVLS